VAVVTTPIQYSSATSGGYYLNNLVAVAEFLMQNGYSADAAAGVAGAIAGESGGNPESEAPGDSAAGLIQWTPPSKASPYPAVTGNPSTDFMDQLYDIINYNNQQGESALSSLNAATSPVAAADIYSQDFERPAVTDSDVRPDVANYVYAAVEGQPTTGILGSTNANLTSASTATSPGLLGLLTAPLQAIPEGLGSGIASAVGASSISDLLIRGGLIVLGGILVIVGIVLMAGGKTIKTTVDLAGTGAKAASTGAEVAAAA
jgi:Phage tail lysozyme